MAESWDAEELKKKMMGNIIKDKHADKKTGSKKEKMIGNSVKDKHADKKTDSKKENGNRKYAGAPYNFVPFPANVYQYPQEKQVWHDDVSDGLFSGEIQYRIKAYTPVIIDDGKGKFYKTSRGEYAIPGSSIRGLIRSNVQILGLSSFDKDIDDYSLMYRNVTLKEEYQEILGAAQIPIDRKHRTGVLKNVKAGYVKKEGDRYVICKTVKDKIDSRYGEMNYYVLSERRIVHEYLESQKGNGTFSYEFFIQNGKSILQHTFEKDFEKKGRHYIGDKNEDYRPYFYQISYDIAGKNQVTAVGKPGVYPCSGYVVSTGPMNEKKAVYIIPEIKESETIEILPKDIDSFKIDLKKKEKMLGQLNGKEYFYLPEHEGEIKPVFYYKKDRLYFGFTPHLRLFYQNTIKKGLPDTHKDAGTDYCKAIFGCSSDNKSWKSKVYFSDAVILPETDTGELSERGMILSEPKPSSCLDYLVQQEGEKPVTYNSSDMQLRGIKQYWLHENEEPAAADPDKVNVTVFFCPLKEGTSFQGTIRFKNMTEDELGLLLWSIRLDPERSMMNIGKAKPYGYGRIALELEYVKRLDKQKAYSLERFEMNPFKKLDDDAVDSLIQTYQNHINDYLKQHNMPKIEELSFIQDFFSMKDNTKKPDAKMIRYMSIDNGEYQSRNKALPSVKEIISQNENRNG